jgi:transposase-like protein
MLKVVETDEGSKPETRSPLDTLALEGARRMLAAALELEVADYVERHRSDRDENGLALVVRNGQAPGRKVTVGSGTMEVKTPRVNDKRVIDGERQRFRSQILPPYLRKSKAVTDVLPVLYLRGLSTGDFREGLAALLGEDASGLSPSAITRLTHAWQEEYGTWKTRSLVDRDYVYVWADGVHFNVRLEDERLAALVIIGARPDGTKEVIAIEDGYRESTESWASVLRDLKVRGMRAPVVAVGDGALGFWAAVRDVWPETREQRCWVHKIANVLDKLPKSLQPKVKGALHEMMYAPTKADCERLMGALVGEHQAKYPKATRALTEEADKLTTHYDFPAEHWQHLRTTNPIESTFATVKLRQRVTKGAGSRNAGLAMAYRLLLLAEGHWRRLNGRELLPLVREGIRFHDGVRIEREDSQASKKERNATKTREKVAA